VDVLGVNYYTPLVVAAATPELRAAAAAGALRAPQGTDGPRPYPVTDLAVEVPQPGPYTDMHWPIDASGMTELLLRVHRDYPDLPLLVTENGAAYPDRLGPDGVVHDTDRIDYLRDHVAAVHAAIAQGADVRGYYLWSLLDNFEWAEGLAKRFGIVHVDFETLQRTPKDSARWYRDVITANGLH
jgi:beta-glucosidase